MFTIKKSNAVFDQLIACLWCFCFRDVLECQKENRKIIGRELTSCQIRELCDVICAENIGMVIDRAERR